MHAVPAAGGEPLRIHEGNYVATHPDGASIVVSLTGVNDARLFRVPLNGDTPTEIQVPRHITLTATLLAPDAIHPDGRLAVRVASPSSWFWSAAIFDPATGRSELVPPACELDMHGPGWADDGTLVTQATGFSARLWRFRPLDPATGRGPVPSR